MVQLKEMHEKNIQRLSAAVMRIANIPQGFDLVHLIGNGSEDNNEQALLTFVGTRYPNVMNLQAGVQVEVVLDDLMDRLQCFYG